MKRVMLVLAMFSFGTLCWAGSAREDATERLNNATSVMHEIMGMPDKGIPEEVLEHAKCVAVIPHMVKGGFVFGAKGGKGVATCRTANGWSAPAFITISGGSWGLQIGVEAVDVVLIIQNDKGMQRLLSSNFQIGGDASAAAGPVGRHAEAGTDWKMDTEILTYSRAKGAFAGLTLEGASLRQDNDSRRAIYGSNVTTRALLLGKVPAPAAAQPFLAEIRGAKAVARADTKLELPDSICCLCTSSHPAACSSEKAVHNLFFFGFHAKQLSPGRDEIHVRVREWKVDMLWTIFVVLLILWLLGFSLHIGGGLIHLLLVVGLVVLVINLLSGRRSAD